MAEATTKYKVVGPTPNYIRQVHTSVLLKELIDGAPDEHFTLDWLVDAVPSNSFGVIMLFLALMSLLPVISVVSRIMILILAMQLVLGYPSPVLPRRLMARQLPSKYLERLNKHAIPALIHLEKGIRPRWKRLLWVMRRLTAVIAVLLISMSLVAPLPFANVPVAIICVLMALAYLEHDGLLLVVVLVPSIAILTMIFLTLL